MIQTFKTIMGKGLVMILILSLIVANISVFALARTSADSGGSNNNSVAPSTSSEGAKAVVSIIGFILEIFVYAGVVLLVYSMGNLILSFRSEDGELKVKAIMMLVISVALITCQDLLKPLFTAFGVVIPS